MSDEENAEPKQYKMSEYEKEYEAKQDRRIALQQAVAILNNANIPTMAEVKRIALDFADSFYGWLQSVGAEPGGLEDDAASQANKTPICVACGKRVIQNEVEDGWIHNDSTVKHAVAKIVWIEESGDITIDYDEMDKP